MAAPEEPVLLRAHPSRLYSLRMYAGAVVLLLAAASVFLNTLLGFVAIPPVQVGPFPTHVWLILAASGMALLLIVTAEVRRIATTYTVTDSRIVRKAGVLSTTMDAVPYRQVERVEMKQSLLQRIAHVGTVAVDTGEDLLLIEHVPRPDAFERTISHRIAMIR